MSDQTDDLLRQADGYAKALYDEDQPLSEVLHRLAASLRASREQVARLTHTDEQIRQRSAVHWIQSECPHGAAVGGKCLTCVTAALDEASADIVRLFDQRDEARATVARLTEENDRLRSLEALHAKQADAANGEVARLTAERDDARAALDRLAETIEQMPRIGFNSTRDSIGPYLRRSAVLEAVRSAARLGSDSEDPTHG